MAQPSQKTGDFVQLMIGCQSRLYAFIMSLVCDPEHAADILQQTNIVMWEKSDQFEPGTNFTAWTFQIARYQVLAHRQRRKALMKYALKVRDRAVCGHRSSTLARFHTMLFQGDFGESIRP